PVSHSCPRFPSPFVSEGSIDMKDAAMKYAALVTVGLFASCLAVGCSSGKGFEEFDVSGAATIDGEPIPTGTITFVAADGKTPTGGGVIKDGRYVAKVPPGEKKVLIVGNKLVGQEPEYQGVPDSPM